MPSDSSKDATFSELVEIKRKRKKQSKRPLGDSKRPKRIRDRSVHELEKESKLRLFSSTERRKHKFPQKESDPGEKKEDI